MLLRPALRLTNHNALIFQLSPSRAVCTQRSIMHLCAPPDAAMHLLAAVHPQPPMPRRCASSATHAQALTHELRSRNLPYPHFRYWHAIVFAHCRLTCMRTEMDAAARYLHRSYLSHCLPGRVRDTCLIACPAECEMHLRLRHMGTRTSTRWSS